MSGPRVAVVGGGIIGLAVAWRLAGRGSSVTVYDPAPGTGASHVAAGMLAPAGEAYFGEEPLNRALLESARRWPAFAAELSEASGHDIGYRTEGTLAVARTDDDLAELARLVDFQAAAGLPVTRLRPAQLRDREPLLAPGIRGGALLPDDRQVDPRRVVAALREAGTRAGVAIRAEPVTELSTVDADLVVVAAGCASAGLTGLPIRPVKGQTLRLRSSMGLRHVIRGYADGRHVYLVPRTGGELVVGATNEERRDTAVTAGAVLDLLRGATELVPGLAEDELVESLAGLRPGTPDNAPVIGRLRPGVLVATGHYRNGVLLAPLTADAVAELAEGGEPDVVKPFHPDRFGGRTW